MSMPPPQPPSTTTAQQLTTSLLTRYSLPISPQWLSQFLSTTRQPHPPIPALTSTAHFRILASDITVSLASSGPSASLLPPNIGDVNTKETRLAKDIPVQVLDIMDVGSSKWSQVEGIERVERGEEVRGREVVRSVPGITDGDDQNDGNDGAPRTNGNGSSNNAGTTAAGAGAKKRSQGPHKLVLQDASGAKVVAFEMQTIPRLWIGDDGMAIGCKIVLQAGTLVRRGMVMLVPGTVRVLGGKIEAWDKKWREDRKARLIEDVTGEVNG